MASIKTTDVRMRKSTPAEMMMTPEQCRAARALLDWSRDVTAARAGVSLSTVADFEAGRRSPMRNNLKAMRAALEAAGVLFVDADDDGGPGVRLASGSTSAEKSSTD